jgi:hypothetical protein
MALNRYCVVLVGITVGLLAWSPVTTAQRVTGRIMTGAQVFEEEGCTFLRVQFSIPIRYTSHFPEGAGDEIRIRVTPFALSNDDQAAVRTREAVRPPYDVDIPVTDISYDGGSLEGPVLLVEFRRPLTYSVGQGSDFRSILIGIPGPERITPCI